MSKERLKRRLRKLIAMVLVFVLSAAMLPAGSLKDGVEAATTTFTAMTLTYNGELAEINLNEGESVPLEGVSAYSITAVNGVTLKNVTWSATDYPDRSDYAAYSFQYDSNHPVFIAGKSRIRIILTVDSGIEAGDSLKVTFLGKTIPFTKSSASTSTTLYYDYWFDVGAPLKELTDISTATVTFPTVTYTGEALYPEPTVQIGSATLEKDVDYILWSYTNNLNAGTGQLTVSGIGNYKNKIQKSFTISPKSINSATVADIPDQIYTGSEITPEITVKDGTKTLTLDTDYAVSYSNNTSVGTASVKIMGKGNYTGNVPIKTFNIVSSENAVSDAVTVNYSDGSIDIKEGELVPVSDAKYSIDTGTVYSFVSLGWWNVSKSSYYGSGDKFAAGDLKIYLKLKASNGFDFPDSIDVTFNEATNSWSKTSSSGAEGTYVYTMTVPSAPDPSKTDISALDYELSEEGLYDYTGSEIDIGFEYILDGSWYLTLNTDYTVTVPEKVKVGAYTITATGKGEYTGTISDSYTIRGKNISSATVSAIPDQAYTGSDITPAFTVSLGGVTLTKDTDYTVSYTNNKAVGNATITINGKGNYRGETTATFKIVSAASTPTPATPTPSAFSGAKTAATGAKLDFDNKYKVTFTSDSQIQFEYKRSGYYTSEFDINIYDSEENLITILHQEKTTDITVNSYETDPLPAGTYYIAFEKASGTDTGVTMTIIEYADNRTQAGAQTVNLSIVDDSTTLTWTQYTLGGGEKIRQYYKLVVSEKTWYRFYDDNDGYDTGMVVANLYDGESEDDPLIKGSAGFFSRDDILLDKGTYLLVAYAAKADKTYTIPIYSREFKDIKSITVQDNYEVYCGTETLITLSYNPAEHDSSITWTSQDRNSLEIINYDYTKKEILTDDKAIIYANALGEYTSTITTSEGISKTITVKVKPSPTKLSSAVATTSSKKKASLTIEWSGNGNYYKIYEKSGNNYKLIKETTASKVTLTKAPGKTYNYKVESCYKVGGEIICSSTGDGVNVITAPYKSPTIKTAKQTGKTKYTKPGTKKYRRWNSYWNYWYWDTMKTGNISTATIKFKIKKVKGAKTYEFNQGKGNRSGSPTSGKIYFSYSGKIKSSTESIKVRGIWKSGITTAYGPWSKTKKIKIKGNK